MSEHMTRPRRWTVSAWYEVDGRTYAGDSEGNLLGFTSRDRTAVVRYWRQIVNDPESVGIPKGADAAWVSKIVTEEEHDAGRDGKRWYELTRVPAPAEERTLWDRR